MGQPVEPCGVVLLLVTARCSQANQPAAAASKQASKQGPGFSGLAAAVSMAAQGSTASRHVSEFLRRRNKNTNVYVEEARSPGKDKRESAGLGFGERRKLPELLPFAHRPAQS